MTKKNSSREKEYEYDCSKWMYVKKANVQERELHPLGIIYVRVSTERQVNEWNWLKSQEDACRRWANEKGITIVQVFSDDGVSGAITSRKWLNSAISYLQKENGVDKNIHYFICTELSRLSRSESTSLSDLLLDEIRDTWVTIRTTMWWEVKKWLKTDAELMVAKNFRLEVKERTINWLKSKMYAWDWVFPLPAWYERVKKKDIDGKYIWKIEKKEPDASIIKEALEMFASWTLVSQIWIRNFLQKSIIWKNSKWKSLWHSYVSRLFNINKLYFYAWQIIYPKYGILQPIPWNHEALISISTLNQILERIHAKWPSKNWERKDTSNTYPLRGLLYCPECWYPLTWRTSKWHSDTYDYYWCKRKWCPWRCNIPVNDVHKRYKDLLNNIKPSNWIIKLVDFILKEKVKNKNNQLTFLNKENEERIREIDLKIDSIKNMLGKISNPVLIEKSEEEWTELEQEKQYLIKLSKDRKVTEHDTALIFDRIKTLLTNPIAVRNVWSLELKRLQAVVFFWEKIYYKKSEGFQTNTFTSLYNALDGLSDPKILNGAGYGIRTHDPLDHNQML